MRKRCVLGLIALLALVSCGRKIVSQKCERMRDMSMDVTFHLMNETATANFSFFNFEVKGACETVFQEKDKEELFEFVKAYCAKKNVVFSEQILGFVLYYDALVSRDSTVTDDHIAAISAFTLKGRRVTHRLYLRNELGDFVEEENVRVPVSCITSPHINFYFNNYVFPDAENKSTVMVLSRSYSKVCDNLERYWTDLVFEVEPRADALE